MAITHVVSTDGGAASGAPTTSAVDTTGATLLIVSVSYVSHGGAAFTVSDSKSNTWIPLTAHIVPPDNAHQFVYAKNATVGTGHTFTITTTGGPPYLGFIVHAFAGVDPDSPFDVENGVATTFPSSPLAPGSVTPSAAGALIITGFAANGFLSGITVGAGMTQTSRPTVGGVSIHAYTGHLVQPVAAAINPPWSWSGSGSHVAMSIAVFLPPSPPVPSGSQVKLVIDGIDRTAWLANGYAIDIEKVLSQESMHLSILDLDSTASAYRPTVGQTIRFTRIDDSESALDIELLFGGIIMQVTDEPIIDDTGTVTRLRCRDWMYLADQIFLPTRIFDSTTAGEMFSTIVDTYLGPKGVTINTIPTGGGVIVPELRIEDPVTTIREALDRLTIASGYPWRMAEPTVIETPGEVWAAMVVPGTFDGPAPLADDGNSVLTDPPLRWEKELLTHATRVWVQTSTSETNSGPVEYTETWTADGVAAVVPVHVIPSEIRASTTAAAESFATSLALDGLPPNAMIRVGGLLAIDWHTQLYTVGATVTTDAEGKATITTLEAMERDVPEGHSVVFKPSAFVQLEINGVVTPMDGVPYVWEDHEHAIVYPGVAWTAGTTILYRTWGYHPFYVREWDPSAQLAVGWFDYGALVDQFVTDENGHTDLAEARAFAQAELARRLEPAKRVTCTTRIPGHYPLLTVPMNFPDRLVTGDYLITETRIRMSTIDETSDEQPLFYELVLMEGDALGESWIQYFRGRNPSQGIKWGPVHDAAFVSQVAIEVMLAGGPLVDVSQVAIEVMEQPSSQVATVSQVVVEVMIA